MLKIVNLFCYHCLDLNKEETCFESPAEVVKGVSFLHRYCAVTAGINGDV